MYNSVIRPIRKAVAVVLCLAIIAVACPVFAEMADTEEFLRLMLSDTTGFAEIPYFFYNDYDGDGYSEAFAFVGEGDLSTGAVTGDLYYVSAIDITPLQIGLTYSDFQILGTAAPFTFAASGISPDMVSEVYYWNVINSAPMIVSEGTDEGTADSAAQLPAGTFSYSETGIGECTITGYTGTASAVLVPSSLGGLSVVAIGDHAFAGNTSIVSLALPAYVRSIGYNAFGGCSALSTIIFTAGIENIGAKAFADCASLTTLNLPLTVKSVGAMAFSGCSALQNVSIAASDAVIDPTAFENCPASVMIAEPVAEATPEATPEFIEMPIVFVTPVPEVPAEEPVTVPEIPMEVPEISIDQPVSEVPAEVPEIIMINPAEPVATSEPSAIIPTAEPTYTPIDEILNDLTLSRSSVCYPCNYDVSEGCAIDGKLNTAWNSDEYSVGEWLSFTAPVGTITTLAGIRIINGYIKSDSVYRNNSRVRSLDVYCDGAYVETLPVSDCKTMQTLWLSQPVSGNTFRFEIADAYYGSKYNDLGITEIELMGVNNEDFHTGDFAHWGRAVKRLVSTTKDGSTYRQGDSGYAVVGLQLLLKRGFGVLSDEADGSFGPNTRNAVVAMMDAMRTCPQSGEMEPMSDGIVDAAFMRNLRIYIKTLN